MLLVIVVSQQVLLTDIRPKVGYLFLLSDLHIMRLGEIKESTSAMSEQLDEMSAQLDQMQINLMMIQ